MVGELGGVTRDSVSIEIRRGCDELREAAALVDAGKLAPLVDPRRFTLDQLADAHRTAESGRPLGKVVVDIATGPVRVVD